MMTDEDLDTAQLSADELLSHGLEALRHRNYPAACRLLHRALHKERSPEHLSQYALALAHHTGNIQGAISLCHEALKNDTRNPELYLRLGTVYLIGGRKKEALRVLQLGLRAGRHPGISTLLQILGHRKKPVLPFLSRSHPLNRCFGKLRARKETKKGLQPPAR